MRARLFNWLYLLIFIMTFIPLPKQGLAKGIEQAQNPEEKAKALLSRLTTAEKVGQLFLVSFKGSTITETDPIYTLITQEKISGVVLSAANDNFSHPENIIQQTQALNQSLQSIKASAFTTTLTTTTPVPPGEYIPLFIGISQEGGDHLMLNSLTE
jgi:hypothetical protein